MSKEETAMAKKDPVLCRWTSCPWQDSPFSSAGDLGTHVETCHITPFRDQDVVVCLWEGCKMYNVPSSSHEWLKRHMQREHTKERPYKCLMNGCHMSFNTPEGLQRHIQRHFDTPTNGPKQSPKVGRPYQSTGKTPPSLIQVTGDDAPPPAKKLCQLEVSELSSESGGEGRKGLQHSKPVVGQVPLKIRKRRCSFKVRIPRHRVMISPPLVRGPTPFNGAHIHTEVLSHKTMSVIRHTANQIALNDGLHSGTCITVKAKVVGRRKCPISTEDELLIQWTPPLALHWQSIQICERLGYIVEELKSYDIVGLQEVWRQEDFAFLVERLESTLPHSHRFRSGAVGSGLCVFSRYPIAAAYTHQFSVTGGMRKLFDGEILAGKAITGYKIQTPGGQIAFFNTHTNPRCREIQLFECLQFVECTRGSDVVILMGDFNTKPRHLAYSLLTKCMGLHDVFEKDPVDTCDLVSNIYTKKWMTPKRIDYIFYSDEFAANHSLLLKDRRLALSGTIPGEDFPYSDHEGVEATFLLAERDTAISVPQRIYDDTAVQVFLEIADCIRNKKMGYETTESRILRTWKLLFAFSLLVSLFFGNYSVFNFLASYYLHWLCTIITCLVGAGSIVWVVTTLSGAQILNGMEATLAEIRVLLKYNSLLRGTGNSDYKNGTGVTN